MPTSFIICREVVDLKLSHIPVPKHRTPRTRNERHKALELFLSKGEKYRLSEAWVVGSTATGTDHPLSDVDLCVKGNFSLAQLYSLRDEIYLKTGVIIQLILDPPKKPRMKVYDTV